MTDFAAWLASARVVIIGVGRSGVAAAELCRAYGARVLATDSAPRARVEAAASRLESQGIELALGGHAGVDFARANLVVISPGVPPFAALDDTVRGGGEVIGEVELAARLLPNVPVIAITGSNGKSTTVTLTGELLAAAGAKPFVGGNLGDPPCELVPRFGNMEFSYGALVLEISSFQAERIPTFRPHRAALLNVSPNHLDRYSGFEDYVMAKGNLFQNQRGEDMAVVPVDDERCIAQARRGRGRIMGFGAAANAVSPGFEVGYTFDARRIYDHVRGIQFERADIRLAGDHNALNVCAALALAGDQNGALDPDTIRRVLSTFQGLGHRISPVASIDGVTYYDDSKGTNVGATVAAIMGLHEKKVVVILGGRDKLGSYEPLVEALKKRGRGAVLIGEAAAKIAEAIGDSVPTAHATSMEDAVLRCRAMAETGDAVLLSPACSSFDMFRDYKHRGDVFAEVVRGLAKPA